MQLYDYQEKVAKQVSESWRGGHKAPVMVVPTGGGKTVTFMVIAYRAAVPTALIAHRQELVEQISMTAAKVGVPHKIIASESTSRRIMQQHIKKLGKSWVDPRSSVAVASVDTLARVNHKRDPWFGKVQLAIFDEGHHVLRANKWGKAADMFPRARFLLPTATPERADGKGLGVDAAGIADDIVLGPNMQQLIDMQRLSPFRIFGMPGVINREDLKTGTTGDYTLNSMRKAFENSNAVGDIVKHYKRLLWGMRTATFVPDVEDAHRVADEFERAGVPAAALSAKTPAAKRSEILDKLAEGEIWQVVNVDLLGEGFDCPGLEAIQMARPTQSFSVFSQQFGRPIRYQPGKVARIVDHVGNLLTHGGPPVHHRPWTLDGRTAGRQSDSIPLRYCTNIECAQPYERFRTRCPYCGTVPEPPERRDMETVEGDLQELDPETLNWLQGQADQVQVSLEEKRAEMIAKRVPQQGVERQVKLHRERQAAIEVLRDAMQTWGGLQQHRWQISRRDAQKLFYTVFKIDVLSALALSTGDAEKLTYQIQEDVKKCIN